MNYGVFTCQLIASLQKKSAPPPQLSSEVLAPESVMTITAGPSPLPIENGTAQNIRAKSSLSAWAVRR
ncbi:hypothetical protein ACNKHN_13000 [Shigella flexneri]